MRRSRPTAARSSRRWPAADEHAEQVADALVARQRVGQRQLRPDRVVVAPAPALACDVAGLDELAHDAVGGALRDAHLLADVAQADARVARDAEQHLGVTGKEGPRCSGGVRHRNNNTGHSFLVYKIMLLSPAFD